MIVLNQKDKFEKVGSLQTALLLRNLGALNKQAFLQPGFCIKEDGRMSICSKYELFVLNESRFKKEGLEDQKGKKGRLQEFTFEEGKWIELAQYSDQ